MAGNKKIFDLPLLTAVTSDDRLAIVDSGNTTTYSVKVSDLRDGTGVNTLESLTGDITFSGTNIGITTSGNTIYLSGSTGGGGGAGQLVAATGTTSYKTANIADSSILGNESIYIGGYGSNGFGEGIKSTAGNNLIIGNGVIRASAGADNTIISGNKSVIPTIGSSNFTGNMVLHVGEINGAGFRGTMVIKNESGWVNSGQHGALIGGYNNQVAGDYALSLTSDAGSSVNGQSSAIICNKGSVTGNYSVGISNQNSSNITASNSAMIASVSSTITGDHSAILVGQSNNISGHTGSVILGGSGLTSNYDYEVQVPNLTIANYSSLNYSGDTAAASGGVVLGQVYHDNGNLRIRIT